MNTAYTLYPLISLRQAKYPDAIIGPVFRAPFCTESLGNWRAYYQWMYVEPFYGNLPCYHHIIWQGHRMLMPRT